MTAIEQFEADHAEPKLYDYPLSLSSVVFDVGGYLGNWTAEILKRADDICQHCGAQQNPYIYVFEPIQKFANVCQERFKDYPKVTVLPFGLYNTNRTGDDKVCRIKMNEAASSLVAVDPDQPLGGVEIEKVELRDIREFIYDNKIERIDLMSINIEGAEYVLLDQITRTGIIDIVKNLQVQFHRAGESYEEMYQIIRERLSLTHNLNWCYSYVWESWSKK